MIKKLLSLLLILSLGACATSPEGRKTLHLMSSDKMNTLGAQSFEQIKQETPASTDRATIAYIECIANSIIPQLDSNNNPADWEVVVFADSQANAFALPGNKIGVYEGLLQYAVNQHQVATVMGHEVAHVIAEHSNERISGQMAAQAGMTIATIVLGSGEENENTSMIMAGLGIGLQYGVILPFSRAHESEADLIGLDLMARAGFDPRQSVPLWQNMASAGTSPPEFMSTHPSSDTRIRDLNGRMEKASQLMRRAHRQGLKPDCKR